MTTQSYSQKPPEQISDLSNIHDCFGEQGKRLSETLIRLTNMGNRLSEDGSMGKGNGAEPKLSDRMPGIISSLYNDIDGFRSLNNNLDEIVSKLEKFI